MPAVKREIGKRLVELRKTLSKDSGTDWTQPMLSQELKLSQNIIQRLEQGSGSIDNLITILDFYHNKGFNTQWAIATDNSKIRMYREDKSSDQDVIKALEKLNKIITNKYS